MVVLSASVLSQNGSKALVSRQFLEMPRLRIEGLLAAFPKLISTNSVKQQMHTFVTTDTIRYVYQPLENGIYVLLLTTKSSNIVEDLGTLRLLAKVVPDVASSLTEQSINEHAFDLIFAFDEMITTGGYRECDVSLSDIRTNLQMESHEEAIHIAMEDKKKLDAKRAMEEKSAEIKKRQMEAIKDNLMGNAMGGGSGSSGMGGTGSTNAYGGMVGIGGGGVTPGYEHNSTGSDYMGSMTSSMSTMFGSSSSGGYNPYHATSTTSNNNNNNNNKTTEDDGPRVVAKGMKLGGIGGASKKKNNIMAAMAVEDNFSLLSSKKSKAGSNGGGIGGGAGIGLGIEAVAPPSSAPSTPLTLNLEEKYTVTMNREGGIESSDLKGTLTLIANTDAGSMASIAINKSVLTTQCPTTTSNWNFATHPKVDKVTYEKKGLLQLKGGKGLPIGRPVGVLRWSYNGDDSVPLSINCWPEDDGVGTITVNVEFELLRSDMTLEDVNILLPLGGTSETPTIVEIDGQYRHIPNTGDGDGDGGMICWHQDVIDSTTNPTGSLEFTIDGDDVDGFFPVQVQFQSSSFLCPLDIMGVSSTKTGNAIPNDIHKSVTPDSYLIS